MTTWPLVQKPDTGENVRTVQYLLDAHGASLATDGIFGPLTDAAVKSFQSANGLAADGIVGPLTWPKLIVQVKMGSNGPAVSGAQSQLHARIKQPAVDGMFGPETNEFVTAFQANAGLVSDGIVGPITWNAMVEGFLGATDPGQAAQDVFAAWAANDQAAAAKNATATAVAELFSRTFSAADGWTSNGCGGAAGHVICEWIGTPGTLRISVNDNLGSPFFFADDITFV
jgi:peptidoglycan hydrolase-like protein with peptidoglycan-binding domain